MNNFIVQSIEYKPALAALSIVITTNNPCHLTCYYTDKEPRRHRTARNQRGLTLPWGVYYCFVAWQSVEQNEPGDTLAHSFEIPGWSYCQTKWFAFRGTIDLELSPSVSCLFQYHHPGPQEARWEHYTINDDVWHIIWANLWIAQTFTPQVSHTITKVRLKLFRVGNPGIVTISIRATSEGVPIGPDLCLISFDGTTLTTDTHGEWRELKFPNNPPLLTDTKYAIVPRCASVIPLNYLCSRADNTMPAYPRGNYCLSADAGLTWSQDTTADEMFEEWGIAI